MTAAGREGGVYAALFGARTDVHPTRFGYPRIRKGGWASAVRGYPSLRGHGLGSPSGAP
jgi:hypothetical protein